MEDDQPSMVEEAWQDLIQQKVLDHGLRIGFAAMDGDSVPVARDLEAGAIAIRNKVTLASLAQCFAAALFPPKLHSAQFGRIRATVMYCNGTPSTDASTSIGFVGQLDERRPLHTGQQHLVCEVIAARAIKPCQKRAAWSCGRHVRGTDRLRSSTGLALALIAFDAASSAGSGQQRDITVMAQSWPDIAPLPYFFM